MQSASLISSILPYFLMLVTVGVGMSLTPQDFRRVVVAPKATLLCASAQLFGKPAIALLIGFALPISPILAVGLILLGACPGGPVANLFTYLARGDAALSICVTVFSNLVTAITLPLIVGWALAIYISDDAAIRLPLLATSMRIVALVVAPVLLGLAIRHWLPRVADRVEPILNRLAAAGVVVILFYLFYREREHLLELLTDSGLAIALFFIGEISMALLISRIFGLGEPQRRAMIFEIGFQNAVLGFTIALAILHSPQMAVALGLYTLVSTTALSLILLWLRRRDRHASELKES